jgi:RNA 3'-terminal phosphate cyclase (ATP)
VSGASLGSTALDFTPRALRGGAHRFEVGSAGSATLVFQTVLPALLRASEPADLEIEGGTHNSAAPPFPFLAEVFAPILRSIGARIDLELVRPGFYPAGGGLFRARVEPSHALRPLVLEERGAITARRVRALVCRVPEHVAAREIDTLLDELSWRGIADAAPEVVASAGPGNVLLVTIATEHVTEVMTGFGERGVRAEEVARRTAAEVRGWLDAEVPVGEHLADQLILPMALGGGGTFRTVTPSLHLRTQIETVRRFLGREIRLGEEDRGRWRVEVATSP